MKKTNGFGSEIKAMRENRTPTASKRFSWDKPIMKVKAEELPPAMISEATHKEAAPRELEKLPSTANGQIDVAEIRENLAAEMKRNKLERKR